MAAGAGAAGAEIGASAAARCQRPEGAARRTPIGTPQVFAVRWRSRIELDAGLALGVAGHPLCV